MPDAVADAIEPTAPPGVVPIAVVATAGTTLTGAVDPIDALADVCAERGRLAARRRRLRAAAAATVPSAGHLFAGLDRVDSVTLDAHKWLYLPKACGVLLVRRRDDLDRRRSRTRRRTSRTSARGHMVDITLEYSRPFRALKLWLAFRAHGAEAFRDAIEDNLRQARLLYELVLAHDDLEPLCGAAAALDRPVPPRRPARRPRTPHNARLVQALQDDGRVWVAPATVDGKVVPAAVLRQLPHRPTTTCARSSTITDELGRARCAGRATS